MTEREIHEALHQVMENTTTIVIAHRLSTFKDMDRILVFVNGEIIEDGSLNALLENKDSHFYTLWKMQAEGFIPSVSVTILRAVIKCGFCLVIFAHLSCLKLDHRMTMALRFKRRR